MLFLEGCLELTISSYFNLKESLYYTGFSGEKTGTIVSYFLISVVFVIVPLTYVWLLKKEKVII